MVGAGDLVEYYAPAQRRTTPKDHAARLYHSRFSEHTITALACDCETAYARRDFQQQKNRRTCPNVMGSPQTDRNKTKDDKPSEDLDNLNVMKPSINRGVEQERTNSLASTQPASDVENFSWPSNRAGAQERPGAADSAVSLTLPTKSTKSTHLREVRWAEEEVGSTNPQRDNQFSSRIDKEDQTRHPSPAKTVLIMLSLYISIFLVALDRTIMGPAIPAITNQFNSLSDVGWYASAYMLTSCGFILLYGRIYTFFPTKPVFLSGIFLFEIGSAICGAAQSSIMLIVGRAVAGLGSSGVFTGAILIMLNTVPLHKRPLLQGLFGACFGVASVTGPLLGGAFTGSSLTWRWCFYINIPLGAVTIIVVVFLLKLEETKPRMSGWKSTLKQMDPLGTALFLPSITCLLLALEWGAAEYAWSSPRLIALLATFATLFIAFVVWQYLTRNSTATVPTRIVLQQSVACGCASQFFVGATMLTVSVYIPLWFQAIKGVSAFQSGINSLPLVLSTVVGSILSGGLVQRIGYYTPFMILGTCCMSVGTGLITTFTVYTESANLIGYLIVLGFGVGSQMGLSNLAVQVVLEKGDIPIGTAILSLFQTLGGAVFTAVGQNLYIDKFSEGLQRIEGVDASHILGLGATDLTRSVAPELKDRVLEAYNTSLTHGTFLAALFIACLSVPAALGMEWRSVKGGADTGRPMAAQDLERSIDHGKKNLAQTDSESNGLQDSRILMAHDVVVQPTPAWRKAFRSSGQFSQWVTVKVNPDLSAELDARR